MNGMKREPAITVATLTALAAAVVTLLTAFGVPLTEEQRSAVLGVVAIVAPFIVGFVVRQYVTPNSSVVESVQGDDVVAGEANEAVETGVTIRGAGSLSGEYSS